MSALLKRLLHCFCGKLALSNDKGISHHW
jgi:hypothetical protein